MEQRVRTPKDEKVESTFMEFVFNYSGSIENDLRRLLIRGEYYRDRSYPYIYFRHYEENANLTLAVFKRDDHWLVIILDALDPEEYDVDIDKDDCLKLGEVLSTLSSYGIKDDFTQGGGWAYWLKVEKIPIGGQRKEVWPEEFMGEEMTRKMVEEFFNHEALGSPNPEVKELLNLS